MNSTQPSGKTGEIEDDDNEDATALRSSQRLSKRDEEKDDLDYPDDEDEDADDVAVEKLKTWFMHAHVADKVITVSCGDASQRIKWLAHVAIARWDDDQLQGWKYLGIPTAVRLYRSDGEELDLNATIAELCRDGDHVFIESSLSPSDVRR